jgi:acyl-CoA thioesterase FadM
MEPEIIYNGFFDYLIDFPHDNNGHLGNPRYFDICEDVRGKLLDQFGWSDKFFNEQGIAMRRKKYLEANFIDDLKTGDKVKIYLEFLKLGPVIFDMHFKFFNQLENLVFEAHTKDTFVEIGKTKPKPIPIPSFFLNGMREYMETSKSKI